MDSVLTELELQGDRIFSCVYQKKFVPSDVVYTFDEIYLVYVFY